MHSGINIFPTLIIKKETSLTYPYKYFVLKRVRQLVASKQNILISVQLPVQAQKLGFASKTQLPNYIHKKNKIKIENEIHAENVPNGVVFTLDGERRRIDDLRVPLVRNPSNFTTIKEGEKSDGVIQVSIEREKVEREKEYLETPSGTTNRS